MDGRVNGILPGGNQLPRNRRVAVIGAGVGGLVAALDLASRGVDVLVLERADAPGGKLRAVQAGGASIDSGPTVFTLRPVFEEIFAACGESLEAHLTLQPLERLARHAWGAHDRLDLFADAARSAEAIGALAGPAEAAGYLDFCARARRIYGTLEQRFIRVQRPSLAALSLGHGPRGLLDVMRISPYTRLWRALGQHFRDPRLRQLFGRYATYSGCSPFRAPATLMLIAHVEQQGVWAVEGGMQRIAKVLAELAAARGARFRYGATVAEVLTEGGRAAGVILADGERIAADAVVVNADAAALGRGLLGEAAAQGAPRAHRAPRSMSALTWSMLAETDGFPLLRHNVFFSDRYAAEFDDVFRHRRLPASPTVYVCAQDRGGGDTGAPGGPERLFCLVNAPPTGDSNPFSAAEISQCEERTFSQLERCGLHVQQRPDSTVATTPAMFDRMFPGTGGALYGRTLHHPFASFQRMGARSRLPGLYLAGGSTHPGPGLPMAALSGRLAASCLLADLPSTSLSRAAVTPGGMSTRSATMGSTG
jgi:1-hydroxycarotenoid 3,4-desaturase